ncbi:MAG: hypothetical protein GTO45_37885 [Candidatus Aminicenantes bacterium]|nr:hypothetical protein [Candidatus Aminicenantes bacterium]NIM80476.1 hypothetical protein [Candidatus Aminicenantes bacterium]NIN23916.1 hypothetical protein [Candidatus Aminicenantes bacterium]NIN47631.1 hypothetical protein [Candidatus Aminicenantes bacterium]NIN90561.1 hypothetical protein [Candidatus Aminicenantes bacterium]
MNKKIEREAERLAQKTGIDFKKYRNPEIVKRISDLIGFHNQTTAFLLKYTGLFLIIIAVLCLWFHAREMSIFGIVLFAIVGILFSVAEGVSLGLIKLVKKGVKDGADTVILMLDFVKEAKQDIYALIKNKRDTKIFVSNVLEGISYDVFIPTVNQIIREKLKLLAKPVNFIIENTIFLLTKSLSEAADKIAIKDSKDDTEQIGSQEAEEQEKAENKYDQFIDEARGKIGPIADSVSRKVAIPARIAFNIALFTGVPILLIIYLIFG